MSPDSTVRHNTTGGKKKKNNNKKKKRKTSLLWMDRWGQAQLHVLFTSIWKASKNMKAFIAFYWPHVHILNFMVERAFLGCFTTC